jgi:hypothetical protein
MSALSVDAVVCERHGEDGPVLDICVTEDHYTAKRRRAAARWGVGAMLTIRIDEKEEASKHAHYKHLHGHLLKPVSDWTGYTETELKAEMKARFLPDGMTSLTEMSADQFDQFNKDVAQCIREEYPSECWDACVNAMLLSDRKKSA